MNTIERIRCSNDDCDYKCSDITKYYSKIIGDDGYYYCKYCQDDKKNFEELQIEMAVNLYDDYLKNKTAKRFEDKTNIPPKLDQVVKYRYLNQYIKNQIPKHEDTIVKDYKEYFLIEKNDLYELEVLLWKKGITFEKLLEKREEKLFKQKSGATEDEREEVLKRLEIHKEEVKQRPHNDVIKRKKKEIELSINQKKEKLDKYKDEPLPKGFKDRQIKKCDYCHGHYCHPFEFIISEKEEHRRKSFKGIICDYCIETKEFEKEQKLEICECGGKYYNFSSLHKKRHHESKKHDDWWKTCRKNNGKIKDYYSYKLNDLRKLVAKNNDDSKKTLIENYYKLKKEDLLNEIIRIDKEGLLTIDELDL